MAVHIVQRLEAEVRTMESSFAGGPSSPYGVDTAHAPPYGAGGPTSIVLPAVMVHVPVPAYVIVDTTCLTAALPIVRAMVASAQFIVVLPLVVLGALDGLKKGKERVNKGAREATRYLEDVLKQGAVQVSWCFL